MAESGCALLLLAAGGSHRLGQPKQLLAIDGEPLVRRVARIALEAKRSPNVLVLGAFASEVGAVLADLPFAIVHNPDWADGVSSSLRVGIAGILQQDADTCGAIVLLADQPHVTAAHLVSLERARRASARSIVATDYGAHLGPPAFFAREHFAALQDLRGDVGARSLLQAFDAERIAAPAGMERDVDTAADYARLLESPPSRR